ncbi:hypothetical protein RUM43_011013 [Polyplax serrata]|uniref:C2H2-type domain-containing protein n=1 Tax=Polyplax serrata TaxID=468196 RepID=A0AAN8RT94_POLSC
MSSPMLMQTGAIDMFELEQTELKNVGTETSENIGLENGGIEEDLDNSLDESTTAKVPKSSSDRDFSSDDDLTLSVQKQQILEEKNKTGRIKQKKKTSLKAGQETIRQVRTVQTQTCVEDDDAFEVVVTGFCESSAATMVDRRKLRSRKTQTPKGQSSSKKRFRIRPAVPSSCTLCDKVYKNSEILRQHMKSHHVSGTIECPSCKLTFTSLRSLKYHEQRKHSNLEPVPCTFCGKKFLDKKYLRIHENIHSQANHFVCQFCGRKFIMKTNLTVHISRHHTKKSNDFICQICGKAFPFKLYLKKHFKTHTDYKPYQCNHCEAKFRENTLLRKHVNSIHLKLRPFLCQYCHKTFTRSLYLREHMESQHLGIQRKVECSRCGESFQNRNRLRQHECMGRMEIAVAE